MCLDGLPHYPLSPPEGPFVTVCEPPLTGYQPKSIVSVRVHSRCLTFREFGQICNDMDSPSSLSYRMFSLPWKVLCVLPVQPHPPLATTDLSTVFLVLPFLEWDRVGIIQHVGILDCLLSLSNMHFKFPCVFSWLGSSFLFSAKYVSLSGWTTANLSLYLLKDGWVRGRVGNLNKAAIKYPCAGFQVDLNCQLRVLSEFQLAQSLDCIVGVCLIWEETADCLPNGWLAFPQPCRRVPVAPCPGQCLLLSVFCIVVVLIGM